MLKKLITLGAASTIILATGCASLSKEDQATLDTANANASDPSPPPR